tara:strand:+ start:7300 stop:8076 length:777 start_codon:yes stop_codon:yes gene_type:complete
MAFHFVIRGRLGNAIFRYLACAVLCINTNNEYINSQGRNPNMTEEIFNEIAKQLIENKKIQIKQPFNMGMFYQHDLIYKKFKKEIIDFINQHPEHSVKTDGITAGDMNSQEFKMVNIINTKPEFSKIYKNVLHVRLEDFVTYNLYLSVERIIHLLEKDVINDELCIVCKQPISDFEFNYLNTIKETLIKKNIKCIFEHNDILTDYYTCKEAEVLICSKSTLSWCAAFFSDKIKRCFLPDYKETVNQTCKRPIDNTELY